MMTSTLLDVSDQEIVAMSRLFGLLGEPNRLRILLLLCEGEMNVSALCSVLGLPQPTVSHHLGLLKRGNLLQARRSGKMIHYDLDGRVDYAEAGELSIRSSSGVHVRISKSGITAHVESDAGTRGE
jgi:ArsR family transcriptional regulator, zinc-responsive transcriptional repressor